MDKSGEAGASQICLWHTTVSRQSARQLVGQGDLALVQKAHDFVAAQYVTPFTAATSRVLGVSEAYVTACFAASPVARSGNMSIITASSVPANCWNGRPCL